MTAEHVDAPVIVFPEDMTHQDLLSQKLAQYQERMQRWRNSERFRYKPPEWVDWKLTSTKTGYAAVVLERLMGSGEVNTYALSRELFEEQGEWFDGDAFDGACNNVSRYCDPYDLDFLTRSIERVEQELAARGF